MIESGSSLFYLLHCSVRDNKNLPSALKHPAQIASGRDAKNDIEHRWTADVIILRANLSEDSQTECRFVQEIPSTLPVYMIH